jgi:PEGA domain
MRRVVSAFFVCLLPAAPLAAIEPAAPTVNVYIDSMGGFGSFLAAAFRVKAIPVVVVADRRQADFEIVGTSESKDPGLGQAILLQGGSKERASVSLINLKNGQVAFAYAYDRSYAFFGKQSAAESCAKHLRTAILKGDVNLRAAAVTAGHHAGEITAVPSPEPDSEAAIPPARQLLPVAIASDPIGARIEIESIDSGRTPAIVKLQPGEYRVTLTLPGYESWQEKFTVSAGNPGALAAAMKVLNPAVNRKPVKQSAAARQAQRVP